MEGNNSNKKIFGGVILLILIGVALGYFWLQRESKRDTNPIGIKPFDSGSVNSVKPEMPDNIGVKPEIDPKDGSVKIVEEFIKSNAKNPGTFEFLEWSEVSAEDGYWKVRCKYTGVSSFNAEVTTNAWFYIQNSKVVYTKIISKI